MRLDLVLTMLGTPFRPVVPTESGPAESPVRPDVSNLIKNAERGDAVAADTLFTVLYSELHRIAKRELARQGAPMSLGATTILHQAYIEISGKKSLSFPDCERFMAYSARVMRGLIIDHARSRHALKRGGQFEITALQSDIDAPDEHELSRISGALDELGKAEPELAEIVDLRFFCGFTFAEIAAMKKISERTAQRHWEKARIYLHRTVRAEVNA